MYAKKLNYLSFMEGDCIVKRFAMLIAWVLAALLPMAVLAQEKYPSQTIRIIVPFAPGGAVDLMARVFAAKLAEHLNNAVIVENRSGAAAQLGIQSVVKAAPDGHTLLVTPSGPISITVHLQKLPYDPATDLVPVAMLSYASVGIAVSQTSEIKTLADLIAAGKSRPQGLNMSVSAIGTHMHLAGALLENMTGAKLVPIAYRGTASAAAAIASGEVDMGVSDLASLLPLARGGRLRILAVVNSARTATAPEIPTVAEMGVPGYGADAWIGLFAPAGTPADLVERLNGEVARALSLPDVRRLYLQAGAEPAQMKPAEMRQFVLDDIKKWGGVIRNAKIKID